MASTARYLVCLTVTALLAAACVRTAEDNPLAAEHRSGTDAESIDEPLDADVADDPDLDPDDVVEAALIDAEDFWARTFPDVYGDEYGPIEGGFWPYGPDTASPPCGEPPPQYREIAANAFYCPSADLIAWDSGELAGPLLDKFGPFTLGIAFAHEIGHAVQTRARVRTTRLTIELQADCFAGAWTADVEAGNARFFEIDVADLESSMAGFLELRDGIGTDPRNEQAHGSAFDRIGAFQDGYERGAAGCSGYAADPPEPVARSFTSLEDLERGGNLPLDEILDLAAEDLEDFYGQLLPQLDRTWEPVASIDLVDPDAAEVTCGDDALDLELASFYCEQDNTITLDAVNLVPELDEIGDFAVAVELARNFAFAAQARLGLEGDARAENLHADCLTGLWSATTFPDNPSRPSRSLFLSPGDLDEAVIAFLAYGDSADASASDRSTGTAFERVDAMRTGFFEGVGACEQYLS